MRNVKRIMAMAMVICMLLVFALPASAVSDAKLRDKMTKLPYLYHGVSNPSAVKALQRFLICDPDNRYSSKLYNDGMDGGFGPTVEEAVRQFQINNGIPGPNGNGTGEVYQTTWGIIADKLSGSSGWLRNSSLELIYYVSISGNIYQFSYYDPVTGRAAQFSTVTG